MKDATSKSNSPYLYDPASFGFPKAEHLCSKHAFTYIFEQGSSFKMGVLKFFYAWDVPDLEQEAPLQVGFSAPKRSFKHAVQRNRLKRRMREAYRLQKHVLLVELVPSSHTLVLFIKLQARQEVDYHRIRRAMYKGLLKIQHELSNLSTQNNQGVA